MEDRLDFRRCHKKRSQRESILCRQTPKKMKFRTRMNVQWLNLNIIANYILVHLRINQSKVQLHVESPIDSIDFEIDI